MANLSSNGNSESLAETLQSFGLKIEKKLGKYLVMSFAYYRSTCYLFYALHRPQDFRHLLPMSGWKQEVTASCLQFEKAS